MSDYHERYRGIRDAMARLTDDELRERFGTGYFDQLRAASADAHGEMAGMSATMSALLPDRFHGLAEVRDAAHKELAARVLAAMVEPWARCAHLRRTPVQPQYILLALRRTVCQRCLATVRRPPPDEDDRCDLCGSRGHETFWPLMFSMGPQVVHGDICRQCARAVLPLAGVPVDD